MRIASAQFEHSSRLPRESLLANFHARTAAIRTAFVARFIVLREGRRTRAHRLIEQMTWTDTTTAEELAAKFRLAFVQNGDKLGPVDRDLKRALDHAASSVSFFIAQYLERETLSFNEALLDYERSNELLFGDEPDAPMRTGGWRSTHSSSQTAMLR